MAWRTSGGSWSRIAQVASDHGRAAIPVTTSPGRASDRGRRTRSQAEAIARSTAAGTPPHGELGWPRRPGRPSRASGTQAGPAPGPRGGRTARRAVIGQPPGPGPPRAAAAGTATTDTGMPTNTRPEAEHEGAVEGDRRGARDQMQEQADAGVLDDVARQPGDDRPDDEEAHDLEISQQDRPDREPDSRQARRADGTPTTLGAVRHASQVVPGRPIRPTSQPAVRLDDPPADHDRETERGGDRGADGGDVEGGLRRLSADDLGIDGAHAPHLPCYSDIASYGRKNSLLSSRTFHRVVTTRPGTGTTSRRRPTRLRDRRGDPPRARRGLGRDGRGLGRDAGHRARAGLPDGPPGAADRARGPRGTGPEPSRRQPGPRRSRVVGDRRAGPGAATGRSARAGRRRLSRRRRPLAVVRPRHRRAQGPRGRPDRRRARGQGRRGGRRRAGASGRPRARRPARLAGGVPRRS